MTAEQWLAAHGCATTVTAAFLFDAMSEAQEMALQAARAAHIGYTDDVPGHIPVFINGVLWWVPEDRSDGH